MITSKKIKKWVLSKTWQPYIRAKISHNSEFTLEGIRVAVHKDVFHPGYFYSTKYLMEFISGLDLSRGNFLELGCGSGLLSIYAYHRGAKVTAVDISKKAVTNTLNNAANNRAEIEVLLSDHFDALSERKFDVIIINPPFFKKDPLNEMEHAWYCGENLEYFQNLFKQLGDHLTNDGNAYMILSDECDINGIKKICISHDLNWQNVASYNNWLEKNFVFKIALKS